MTTTLLANLVLGLLQAAPAAPPRTQTPSTQPTTPPVTAPPPAAPTLPPEPAPTTTVDPFVAPDPAAPAPVAPAPTGIIYMADAAPVPAQPDPGVAEQTGATKYRRLVFSNFYAVNFGIYPIPSGELSVFLGTNLRPRKSVFGTDWNTAIGYQVTLSLGGADIQYAESQVVSDAQSDEFFTRDPIFFHRHALMAQGYGGRNGRLYYAMGAGAVMWRTLLIGIEGEGKLGYIFSTREGSRTKGIVGGQLRLGGPFDGVPLPQFGGFIGFMVF